MASNIPLGTYVTDGVRTGPFYTGQLPQGFVSDNNGVITSSSHNTYGPAVLLSAQNTWNITPSAPGGGKTTVDNLVGQTVAGGVAGAGNLTLLGDNSVTSLRSNGVVQFDWPRVVTVTIAGADATAATHVTIFGTDWYGMPMQMTYVVETQHTYPVILIGAASVSLPAKAFFTVNRVFISAGLPAGCTISLGCADAFGLPYNVRNEGDVTSIGWGISSDLFAPPLGAPLSPQGIFVGGDVMNPATATTGDVRGFYVPSNEANGIRNLRFTYYVRGADTWINQVANTQQLYTQQTGLAPIGVAVAPLTPSDLYGVPQFYTGAPS